MSASLISVLKGVAVNGGLRSSSHSQSLTDAKIKATANSIPDGGGLSLYVSASGSKTWRYRYRLEGKEQVLTIGAYPLLSLAEAREAHRGARWLVEREIHPLAYVNEELGRQKAEESRRELSTFRAVVGSWLAATGGTLAPSTAKYRKAMIERHLLPVLGDIPATGIDRHRLRNLLVGLDAATPETAKQCRSYLSQVFDWCVEYDLVSGNPTPQSSILRNFHTRTVTPRKALDLRQLGAFLKDTNAGTTDALTSAAMGLLILTWCRTSEVVGAAWSEFDLKAGVWRIPASRMKAREPHTIYLSAQAIALLRNLQLLTTGIYLFPNRRQPDTHMNRMTLTNWRKRHGYESEMDIHGFRAVASTWANESGRYRKEVIEVALAHRETDLVRAAYNRATFTGELTQMWQDWADMCEGAERGAA